MNGILGRAPLNRYPDIFAKYETAAGQSIATATTTVVDFGTKNIDTHTAVTTGASWVFTAPEGGLYLVSSHLLFVSGGGWDAGESALLGLRKNTSLVKYMAMYYSAGTHAQSVGVGGTETVYCNKGDTIDVIIRQNTGGSVALNTAASENWISITRISR